MGQQQLSDRRRNQIETLAHEAYAARDPEQVRVCQLALAGDDLALRRCDRAWRQRAAAIADAARSADAEIDRVVEETDQRCRAIREARTSAATVRS
jgi:hypothetical protein